MSTFTGHKNSRVMSLTTTAGLESSVVWIPKHCDPLTNPPNGYVDIVVDCETVLTTACEIKCVEGPVNTSWCLVSNTSLVEWSGVINVVSFNTLDLTSCRQYGLTVNYNINISIRWISERITMLRNAHYIDSSPAVVWETFSQFGTSECKTSITSKGAVLICDLVTSTQDCAIMWSIKRLFTRLSCEECI